MHTMGRLLVFNAGCLLLLAVAAIPVAESTAQPVVYTYPPEDQFIASTSDEDVVYSCTVEPLGNATAIWELNGTQLNTEALRQHVEGLGIYIYDKSASELTINFTRQARREIRRVQCVGSVDGTNSKKGDIFHVRSFDSPLEPRNVRLVPGKNGPQLQWERPRNVPKQVETTYIVNITSAQDGTIVYENTTTQRSLPLRLVEDHIGGRECGLYQISVYGVNDAGRGLISEPVIETIPQSPSVSNLSQSLAVEAVTLGSLSAVISFAKAEVCSENFTLTNYSAVINGRITFLVDADRISPSPVDEKLRLELNESSVQDEFLPGSTYEVAVRACTAVTCRTSTTVVLNTTDTQQVDILMFEDRLFVRCTFADQSDALGCNVRFSVMDSNETEVFLVNREKEFLCNQTKYPLGAYSNFTVGDLQANGTEGDAIFIVAPHEIDTLDEFLDITNCPQDLDVTQSTDRETAAIIAGVVCAIVIAIIAALVVVVVAIVCARAMAKKKRVNLQQEPTKLLLNTVYDAKDIMSASEQVEAYAPPEQLQGTEVVYSDIKEQVIDHSSVPCVSLELVKVAPALAEPVEAYTSPEYSDIKSAMDNTLTVIEPDYPFAENHSLSKSVMTDEGSPERDIAETSGVDETDLGGATMPTGEGEQITLDETKKLICSHQQQERDDRLLVTKFAEYKDNILTIKASLLAQKVFKIQKAQYSKLKVKFE